MQTGRIATRTQWIILLLAVALLCLVVFLPINIPGFSQSEVTPDPSSSVTEPAAQTEVLPPADSSRPETPADPVSEEKPPLRFIVFGDSGSGMTAQKQLALQMRKSYDEAPFSLALILGDIIYPDGNVKKYGHERFTVPYRPLTQKGVLFFPALGNHDVDSGFREDVMAFFKMPAGYYDYTLGNVHFYVLDTNRFDETQRQWLDQKLSASEEPWKVVYGHHPLYSSGLHGNSRHLIKTLKPVLEKHRVDIYLAGHDHNYERFAPKYGVQYVVSGGGGASLRRFLSTKPGSLIRVSKHHFLRFSVTENEMRFEAVDTEGKVIDSASIVKPQQTRSRSIKPAA